MVDDTRELVCKEVRNDLLKNLIGILRVCCLSVYLASISVSGISCFVYIFLVLQCEPYDLHARMITATLSKPELVVAPRRTIMNNHVDSHFCGIVHAV